MIPRSAKLQMASEAIDVKAKEPQNAFEAFIMVASGMYYFWIHHKKGTLITGVLSVSVTVAVTYFIDTFIH